MQFWSQCCRMLRLDSFLGNQGRQCIPLWYLLSPCDWTLVLHTVANLQQDKQLAHQYISTRLRTLMSNKLLGGCHVVAFVLGVVVGMEGVVVVSLRWDTTFGRQSGSLTVVEGWVAGRTTAGLPWAVYINLYPRPLVARSVLNMTYTTGVLYTMFVGGWTRLQKGPEMIKRWKARSEHKQCQELFMNDSPSTTAVRGLYSVTESNLQ